MNKKNKNLIIIICVLIVLIISGAIFVLKINNSQKESKEVLKEIKETNTFLISLINQNEQLLNDLKEKYNEKKLKEALDNAIQITQNSSRLTDNSLKLIEQLKNALADISKYDEEQRKLVLQLIQNQLSGLNSLKDYCEYGDAVKQGIAAEYESLLDKVDIEIRTSPAPLISEMNDALIVAKQNFSESLNILKDL